MKRVIVSIALGTFLGAGAAVAGERHSGVVVAVQPDGGAFTLEEMTSWKGDGTGLVRRQVRLRPDTLVLAVRRAPDLERAWPVAFETAPLDAGALRPGDYVTVTLRDDAGDVAESVEVVTPGS
ncbi:MAG TPA: hypothetical protein VGT02_18705 [Methylomirabilota bacterium]|nr:hypothetical protein [Methylomirabilota bacterium]